MTTVSGASPDRDPQSGAASPDTPYDRPGFLNSALRNLSWISRNIFPPTRAIVTGAGRVLASVLGFESSSSSSSSECGSCSDGTHDNNDDQEVSSQGVHAIEYRVPQSFAGKNESKCLIEQLLMEESFSRQECDKLTDIIKSKVVDSQSICGLGVGRLDETPERTAVLEATKLLEEKKSGSNDKSEGHHGASALNSVMLKHDVEGEVGLPVDLAKSYMQTCPPWASPSKNNTEFRSPSSVVMSLFKEDTPYSIGGNFLYSSKRKRNSLATGSWNIQDEIRKVRYKATEEMLRNLSSSKIDWPSIPLEHKKGPDSMAANNLGPYKEDNLQISKRPVDVSTDLAAKSVSQLTKDVFHIDALQDQVMQPTQSIKKEKDETFEVGPILQSTVHVKTEAHSDVDAPEAYHLKKSNGSIQPFSRTREGTAQDSRVEDKNCWTLNDGGGICSPHRFPSGSNMSCEADKEKNHGPIINEEDKAGACRDDDAFRVVAQEKRELLREASTEVPTLNETDAADSGSHRSWSMQNEGSPQDRNTPTSKTSPAGKRDSTLEQQQQRERVSRYNTRNRGRHR